jgi:hypothetical protein
VPPEPVRSVPALVAGLLFHDGLRRTAVPGELSAASSIAGQSTLQHHALPVCTAAVMSTTTITSSQKPGWLKTVRLCLRVLLRPQDRHRRLITSPVS